MRWTSPRRPLPPSLLLLMLPLALTLATSCSDAPGSGQTNIEDQGDTGTQDVDDGEPDSDDLGTTDVPEGECGSDADCDDGIFCNGRERCSEGQCFDAPQPPCIDTLDCTVDRCNEDSDQCTFVGDDSLCAEDEVCDLKAGCFAPSECQVDADCDDGLICNGTETCAQNNCQPGTPLDCDDGIACTDDTCVEELGACQTVPIHTFCLPTELCNIQVGCDARPPCTRDDDCDDASFCNGTETCDDTSGECVPGELPEVDDGVECTVDTCSDERGEVLHRPNPSRCSDGLFCNGAEICHPVDGCQEGSPPVLSDGVGCTEDSCNEEADFVEHIPINTACDDGLFCNGEEVCHPIDGCSPGEPPVVNDGIGCTVDTCSEIEGAVLNVPTDEVCNDGLFCNGIETCDPEIGCVAGELPALDDEIDCTTDTCDEANDQIVHSPNNGACQDGVFCNGAEVCTPGVGCEAGPTLVVDDGIECTTDSCDEDADQIVNAPDDGVCNDGLFCNGAEVCTPGVGCGLGTPPTINDGIGCTVDVCDEVTDTVSNTPTDSLCDDSLFCNGAEFCDAVDDCQSGVAPTIDDGIDCTIDTCDEAGDTVVHAPDNGFCDNAFVCDGAEVCQPDLGCVDGTPADEGAVCEDTPRSICLDNKCEPTRCGDGFTDEAEGEQCDDGGTDPEDGCDENCQLEGGFEYNGVFSVNPNLTYLCQQNILDIIVIDLINYSWDRFDFDVVGDTLRVRGLPVGLPDVTMTQSPAPTDGTFDVTFVNAGGCTETYRLTGVFNSDSTWSGAYSLTLSGSCGECTDHLVPVVSGTRQ